MRIGTWFLRLVLAALALLVGAVGAIPIPIMLRELALGAALWAQVVVGCLAVGLYLAMVAFLVAVVLAWQLLGVIDHGLAFSQAAVTKLRQLKWTLVAITLGVWLWLPFIYVVVLRDDAPGLMLMGLALAAVPLVLTVFMAVLQRLWQSALAYKVDHDLTI